MPEQPNIAEVLVTRSADVTYAPAEKGVLDRRGGLIYLNPSGYQAVINAFTLGRVDAREFGMAYPASYCDYTEVK